MNRRTLVSWIGGTDLASMGNDLGGAVKEQVEQATRRSIRATDDGGPIKSLLQNETFDAVHLLNNYHQSLAQPFIEWLGVNAVCHHVEDINSPTDYASIYVAVDKFLNQLFADETTRPTELCIFLSPGTPAMAASWVLIGKNKYNPIFFQTFNGESSVTQIPFDLKLHIKDIVGKADSAFEQLRGADPEAFEAFADLIGNSAAMKDVIGRAQRIAIRDVPVLILGESGTGKTHVAQAIHKASARSKEPFKTINCAALPAQLLESELFGHTKGAFTGADTDKAGLFETAHGGTMFLDEIGECPLELQAKLLTVLQPDTSKGPSYRTIRRVGSDKEIHVDVRVIAATNRNLVEMVNHNQFREDLYYRLAAIAIRLPPLRKRGDDIFRLAESLLDQINSSFGSNDDEYLPCQFDESALEYIKNQRWPGNVRQIYNVLLQAAVMTDGDAISAADLMAGEIMVPGSDSQGILDHDIGEDFDLNDVVDLVRKHYFERALKQADTAKSASKLLGYKTDQTFRNHMKDLGL